MNVAAFEKEHILFFKLHNIIAIITIIIIINYFYFQKQNLFVAKK